MSNIQFEDPNNTRINFVRTHDRLVIKIPAKRNVLIFLFIALWLCVWTIGGYGASKTLLFGTSDQTHVKMFLLFWLGGWLLGELYALSMLLWMVFGYERIEASVNSISRSFVAFVQLRRKNYSPDSIKNMRTDVPAASRFQPFNHHMMFFFGGPGIKFEYGAKTVSVGLGLDQGEAKAVISAIEKATARKLGAG